MLRNSQPVVQHCQHTLQSVESGPTEHDFGHTFTLPNEDFMLPKRRFGQFMLPNEEFSRVEQIVAYYF
jgi:hypothetical protein